MAIDLTRPSGGLFDGAGVTIRYVSPPKQFDDCMYYCIQCDNPKSPHYKRICNARCRKYKKRNKNNQPKPVYKEVKDNFSFKNKDHTLCKYYEKDTGKCKNAYAGVYFPTCEEPCRLWEKSKNEKSVNKAPVKAVKKGTLQPKITYKSEDSHDYVNLVSGQQKMTKKVFGKKRKRIDLIAALDKPKTHKRKTVEAPQKNTTKQWYTSCKYYDTDARECHYKVKCRDKCLFFKEKR